MAENILNFAVATNESGPALLIPYRPGRGAPTRIRYVQGAIMWRAEDDVSEVIGLGQELPSLVLDRVHAGLSLTVFEVNSEGVPVKDFVLELSEFSADLEIARAGG